MTKASPFIQDRAVPVYPSLAIFLDYLPGVDDHSSRDKSKIRQREYVHGRSKKPAKVGTTLRGLQREIILTQLDHRLIDSPRDNHLVIDDAGGRWYACTYEEWQEADLQFLPFYAIKKTFQDLIEAGYIKERPQTDFMQLSDGRLDRKKLMRVTGVYKGKCFTIDYEKLEADMTASVKVQAYYARNQPRRTLLPAPNSSDQGDPMTDQGDPSSMGEQRINAIRGDGSGRSEVREGMPDQGDPTPRINVIRESAESLNQQTDSLDSAASTTSADQEADPTPGRGDLTENRQALELDDGQVILFAKLTAHGLDIEIARDYALTRKQAQIDAWLDYIRRSRQPGSELKPVKNSGGFLRDMLKNPSNYPRDSAAAS